MAKRKVADGSPLVRLRPKRRGAGKGGLVLQLEKCSDAITRVSKRPRNDDVHVPSSEVVNPMAPRTSPRKRRKRGVKTQPNPGSNLNDDAEPAVVVSSGVVSYASFLTLCPR
jgi:hypothetical protein